MMYGITVCQSEIKHGSRSLDSFIFMSCSNDELCIEFFHGGVAVILILIRVCVKEVTMYVARISNYNTRASENRARWARRAEAEILKWMNEWKKYFGLHTLRWSQIFFSDALAKVMDGIILCCYCNNTKWYHPWLWLYRCVLSHKTWRGDPLTHWGLVTPFGGIDLGQHWFR